MSRLSYSASGDAPLACYFSLAVFGSTVDEFGFTNVRSCFCNSFSNKINVRIMIIKGFSFLDVEVVSISGKDG